MPLILIVLLPIMIFFIIASLNRRGKINIGFLNKIERSIDNYAVLKFAYYFILGITIIFFLYALLNTIIILLLF